MKLVLASDNKNKLREFRELLADFDVELLSKAEAGVTEEVDETGKTFAENARLKAEAVMRATGLPAIADDSGLCIYALHGEPGVLSARYTGRHEDSDEARRALVLRKMEKENDRRAYFVCSLCCLFPDGGEILSEQCMEGTILREARGTGGFGYDPIFLPDGSEKSNAELSPDEKNALSHRGKALRDFLKKWEMYHADK